MIDRQRNGEDLREVFKVLGSTGNLFIFLKVLDVPVDSKGWYQKYVRETYQDLDQAVLTVRDCRALISSELQEIFDNARPNPASVASQRVREAYGEITGTSSSQGPSKPTQPPEGRRKFEEDDECAVCYETLKDVPDSDLVWCGTCKNALHKECFSNYRRSKIGQPVTCPHCRSEMDDGTPVGKGKGKATISEDGYLNLASAAGVSRVRDTSTYYDGPSRRWSNYRAWI
ncbi:hypothetical protein FRC00_006945 [Tulasnella sp. 408]|nr:hypothetical protein FRC00_006945 [Tulasnella sp. 408]